MYGSEGKPERWERRSRSPTLSSTPHSRKRGAGDRSAYSDPGRQRERSPLESEDSAGGHWKSRSRKDKGDEDDLYCPYDIEDTDPFTHRIRNFEFPKRTKMPSNVKIYNGTGDPEDHLKNFYTAAKVERWAMPTWCHMFNSTLMDHARMWFDELPPESIDNFEDLWKSFLSYFLQQKKYAKDPVELHHIKKGRENQLELSLIALRSKACT
ncbi:reverse transcriptase domain-containing protein [Artemisia annua]|uniref:Reverse transcriptase domain-containing protein n=1 Tax=Artemisia annua TaxID=35608 RepID=A0A2U1QIK1_ARTAN|nr:reverse transcriptase domain-containing protein [Artemisia annua]